LTGVIPRLRGLHAPAAARVFKGSSDDAEQPQDEDQDENSAETDIHALSPFVF
jgi:hypothetical protein